MPKYCILYQLLAENITDFTNPFQYDGNLLINLINLENSLKDKKQKRSSPFLFFEKGKRNRINCCKIEPNTISMKLLPHSKTKHELTEMFSKILIAVLHTTEKCHHFNYSSSTYKTAKCQWAEINT